MSRSTIILVIVLIVALLWFGSIFSTCSAPGRAFAAPGGGIWPIFLGGGGGWDRGGWDRGGSSSSPSIPSSGRGAAGTTIRGGGISGGSGGK